MNAQHSSKVELSNGQRCAFSLVELLVCIAIIATLAALIAVAVTRSSLKARQVRCISNLRQHGIALANFTGEMNSYPLLINPGQRVPDHGISFLDALSTHGLGAFPSDGRSPNSVHF